MDDNQENLKKLKEAEKEFKPEMEKDYKKEKPQERRPSGIIEMIIVLGLMMITFFGVMNILGAYLANAFNSVFGMGLK